MTVVYIIVKFIERAPVWRLVKKGHSKNFFWEKTFSIFLVQKMQLNLCSEFEIGADTIKIYGSVIAAGISNLSSKMIQKNVWRWEGQWLLLRRWCAGQLIWRSCVRIQPWALLFFLFPFQLFIIRKCSILSQVPQDRCIFILRVTIKNGNLAVCCDKTSIIRNR